MPTLLFAFLALQTPPAAPAQEEKPPELKWTLAEGDHFDFKWSYVEARKMEQGKGGTSDLKDSREVEAELAFKEAGVLVMTLKKISWTFSTGDFDVTLSYADGKKPDVKSRNKVGAASPGFQAAKGQADRMSEMMKTVIDGEYAVNTVLKRDMTVMTRNGSVERPGPQISLFDRLFLHGPNMVGSVQNGQTWKDPTDGIPLRSEVMEVKTIEHKITKVGADGIYVKGGMQVPVAQQGDPTKGQTTTGSLNYSHEWSFSRQEYLQSAKEEATLTCKVDAKGKDADFYRSNTTHTVKQSLTLKKKPPPKQP